jgi:hypothetical protein
MTILLQRGILSTPRRSSRLAAKSRARISKPHLQARKVLLKKLGLEQTVASFIDTASFEEFQETFKQ